MLNFRQSWLTVALLFALIPAPVSADVVSTGFSGIVTSVFKLNTDSATSILPNDMLLKRVSQDNSFTETALNWSWDGTTLSGNSLLTASKTVAARPGGAHRSSSDFVFAFTVDSTMDLTFGGLWGFSGVQGINDLIMLELAGPSGIIVTDTSTGTTGIGSDAFSWAGTLNPGTYTLSFSGDLVKTINNAATAQGGWSINQFTLVNIAAVPEPSVIGFLALVLCGCNMRGRR